MLKILLYSCILVTLLITLSSSSLDEEYQKALQLSAQGESSLSLEAQKQLFKEANLILAQIGPAYWGNKDIGRYADCMARQSTNLIYSNQIPEGIYLLEEGIKAILGKTKTEQTKEIGLLYHKLGVAYNTQNDLENAEKYYIMAIGIRKNTIGEEHPDYIKSLSNLATVQKRDGKFPEALNNLYKCSEAYERINKTRSLNMDSLNMCLNSEIADVLSFMQDFKRAEEYGIQSVYLAEKLNNPYRLFLGNLVLCNNAVRSLNSEMVIYYGSKVMEYYGSLPNTVNIINEKINFLNSIATANRKLRQYDKARFQINEALSLVKQLDPSQRNEHLARLYNNYSLLETSIGNTEKAIGFAQNAAKLEGVSYPLQSESYLALGTAHIKQNNFDKALDLQFIALQKLTPTFKPPQLHSAQGVLTLAGNMKQNLFEILYAIVETQDLLAQKTKSLHQYEILLSNVMVIDSLISDMRSQVNADGSKYELTEQVLHINEKGIGASFLLYRQTKKIEFIKKAFYLAERNKASALMDVIRENQVKMETMSADPNVAKERNLRLKLAKLDAGNFENQDSIKRLRIQLIQELDKTSLLLKKSSPALYQLKYAGIQPEILSDLQRNLDTEQALVEYFIGEQANYVFVVTSKMAEMFDLGKIDPSGQDSLLFHIRSPSDDVGKLCSSSHDLYATLFKQADQWIPPSCKRLTIVPDGKLAMVPFESLLSSPPSPSLSTFDQAFLIKRYSFSYSLSAQLHIQNKAQSIRGIEYPFVGFAPDFGDMNGAIAFRNCTNNSLGKLSYNRYEISELEKINGGRTCMGADATVKHFEQLIAKAGVLHIATHACVDDLNASDSKIFFANQEYLTLDQIYQMQTPARMVVLSACETGVGNIHRGEGMISLNRAFASAGCPSVVSSLWAVGDQSTSKIMKLFYENLKKGYTKDVAMQKAKIALLQSGNPALASPQAWAAFVQYGNTEALYPKTKWWLWAIAGGLIMAAILAIIIYLRPSRPFS